MPKPDSIHSNERELASKISEWFNDILKVNNFPFKESSNETSIVTGVKTLFGDIVLWKNRQANEAYSLIELKRPFGAKENLDTFRKKADKLRVNFAFTWDFQSLNAYSKKDNFTDPIGTENINILNNINDWFRGDVQSKIKAYLGKFCDELFSLEESGHLKSFIPERHYFVNLIRETVNSLIPSFEQFIKDSSRLAKNKALINSYVVKQGIAYPNEEEYFRLIASQRVYSLVIKIIFYLTVKRYFKELPDLDDSKETDLSKILKVAFKRASEKDWQAVFVDDPIDELGIPSAAYKILLNFFSELKVYHFGELPEDVISEIYTEIIDPEHRHSLGQYFTNEDLVDFILGATVNEKDGHYCDPTSGSGTFLIRLYDRLKYISNYRLQHNEKLSRIWGVDIAKFPAELSTINLFRQEVKNFDNFPRIINKSIFDIHKGSSHEFPPPNAGNDFNKINVKLPEFNSIVGNFPFIRQELIEKKDKGYKLSLTKLLAEEYLFSYPELFNFKKIRSVDLEHIKTQTKDKQIKTIQNWIDKKEIEINLSGQADIYAYIFLHTATLLSQKGTFGIITSNSWLDVSYGSVLKDFFLSNFKIKMIIASWAEPWFEDAAVNTVITILEKEPDEKSRNNNIVKFVKLKKKFSELIPYRDLKLESSERWNKIDSIIRTIETAECQKNCKEIGIVPLKDKKKNVDDKIISYEDDNYRIRILSQSALRNESEENKELSKWIKFLRAPDVYFDILEKCKDNLIPLSERAEVRRGYTTGINEFFYLEKLDESENNMLCRNTRGWEGEIEKQFLKKVFKSPKDSESIKINPNDLNSYILLCDKSKKELSKDKYFNILKYIEWGEKQKTKDNIKWNEVPTVIVRKYWYNVVEREPFDFFTVGFVDKRFMVFINNLKVCSNDVLFEWRIFNQRKKKNLLRFLNSSLFYLFLEVNGRINLGDGVLKIIIPDLDNLLVINENNIEIELPELKNRNIKSIFDEVKEKDRNILDTEILKSLGLNPKEYLSRLYDGLCIMVKERLELPKMRKTKQKQTIKVAYDHIKDSVLTDIAADGLKKFPDAFYLVYSSKSNKLYKNLPPDLSQIEYESIPTTGKTLKYEQFMGQYTLLDEDEKTICQLDSEYKAQYALIINKPDVYQLKIPKDENIVEIIITNYKNYIEELKKQLLSNAKQKLHDQSTAERMTDEILKDFNIII